MKSQASDTSSSWFRPLNGKEDDQVKKSLNKDI
jgi:hypothetical protein